MSGRTQHLPSPSDAARQLLAWWADVGVETSHIALEAPRPPQARMTASAPINRAPASGKAAITAVAGLEAAQAAAAGADSLPALKAALEAFEGCGLKKTARNLVFADGMAGSDVMLIGEAPGADEDAVGLPFVGRAGQFLDVILASIGLRRSENLYITNVVPWRPPGNRAPSRDELAICRPFVIRHIQLAKPKRLILAGGVSASSILGLSDGITKLRTSTHSLDLGDGSAPIPVHCVLHPAYLLRRPAEKSLIWKDLLRIIDEL